jgi:hypothetical protein
MKLAWGAQVSDAFARKALRIAGREGWSEARASWLMTCIAFESARTFSASVQNQAGSGATGLIQFMPATAKGLGTTTSALRLMTPEGQLDYVEAYFKPYLARLYSLSDFYMAILLPGCIGKPEDHVLFSGGVAYRQNSGLDANTDGKITKAEAAARVERYFRLGIERGRVGDIQIDKEESSC